MEADETLLPSTPCGVARVSAAWPRLCLQPRPPDPPRSFRGNVYSRRAKSAKQKCGQPFNKTVLERGTKQIYEPCRARSAVVWKSRRVLVRQLKTWICSKKHTKNGVPGRRKRRETSRRACEKKVLDFRNARGRTTRSRPAHDRTRRLYARPLPKEPKLSKGYMRVAVKLSRSRPPASGFALSGRGWVGGYTGVGGRNCVGISIGGAHRRLHP